MRYTYVAEFEYGMPNLSRLEVVEETPRAFQVGACKRILGHAYIGKHVFKETSIDWFSSALDAVTFLAGQAELNVMRCQEKLERAKRALADLEELMKELEE